MLARVGPVPFMITIVDHDDVDKGILRFLFAYYRHLCTPFISSSLTAGSFISNMPGSFIGRGVEGGKDGSIHVFFFVLCLGKVSGVVSILRVSVLSICDGPIS